MNGAFWTAAVLAFLFSVLAAVGTPAGGGGAGDLVYVLDVSRSHGPAPDLLRDRLRQWHERSSLASRPHRVILAGTTAVEGGEPPPGFAEGSRVDLGLELCRTARRGAEAVVVLSDGRFDHARAAREVEALSALGVAVRFEGPLAHPALDMRLVPRGPALVEGGVARVKAGVTGTNPEAAKLSLQLIGAAEPFAGASIVVAPGATEEFEALVPVAPAARSVTARIALEDGPDAAPSNDELVIPLQRAERRALIVGARQSPQAAVAVEALEASGFEVEKLIDLTALQAGRLADLDLLVLVDQPVASVPAELVRAIETAVTEGGVGLWVVGGAHAFGAGGYAGSRLDDLLPLSSRPANARRIVIVLDTSGSMEKDDRLSRAIVALTTLADTLAPEDRIHVIPFAQAPSRPVPAEPSSPADFLARAIPALRKIAPRGGTRLVPALEAALQKPHAGGLKDVLVLVTDARDDEVTMAELLSLRQSMLGQKVDSIVVLLDPTPETRDRADALATARVIPVTDWGPRILVDVLDFGAHLVPGPIESVLPDGTAGPRIAWRNGVRAGAGALVALATKDREPLMASAFRGVGTAAAWAAWPASRDDAVALGREWAQKTARAPQWKQISVGRENDRLVISIPEARVPAGEVLARVDGGAPRRLIERTPGVFELRPAPGGLRLALLDGDRILAVVPVPPAGDPEYAFPPVLPAPGPEARPAGLVRMRAPWAALGLIFWGAAVATRLRRA